jgi:hypothetical protein
MQIDNKKKTRKKQLPFCGHFWSNCQEHIRYENDCHLGKTSPDFNEDYCPYVAGTKYCSTLYYIAYDDNLCENYHEWAWDRVQRYIYEEELPISMQRVTVPFPLETSRGSGKYQNPEEYKECLEHIWELGGTGYLGLPFMIYHIGDIPIRRLIGREANAAAIINWLDNSWDKAQVMLGLADSATKIKAEPLWLKECAKRKEGTYVEPDKKKLERGRYTRKEEDL